MSRIGKLPITLPKDTEVKINGSNIYIKGKLGILEKSFPSNIKIKLESNKIILHPLNKKKFNMSMWGTSRSIINNMIIGVSSGFTKKLHIVGRGYKSYVKENILSLYVGKSHGFKIEIPEQISVIIPQKNIMHITGINKEQIGIFCSLIISLKPVEPYKGKGIRYSDQIVYIKDMGKGRSK